MDAQDFRSLQEAYLEVVENQQLHELSNRKLRAYIKKSDKSHKEINKKWDQGTATEKEKLKSIGHEIGQERAFKRLNREELNIYDIILSHLLDEGYADTQEAAEAIMVNMSEEWRESIMISEGMTMKDFKANRQKNKRRSASADAEKRGHVGKEWYNSGRKYSPDEAKRSRAKMDDEERRTRHRSAVDPDNEDDNNYSADKTKNPKKLRKQKAMGELG